MIIGKDPRNLTLATMLWDINDIGYIRRVAQTSDKATLDYYIEKVTTYGEHEVAKILKESATNDKNL